MKKPDPRVDAFLRHVSQWREELSLLRSIMLSTDLVEDYKWGQPCYTHNGKNLVLLGGFKSSFVVSFFNGALLADPLNILEFAGPNSKTAKVMRFASIEQIQPREDVLRAYVAEAIHIMEVGKEKSPMLGSPPMVIPEELDQMFLALPALKAAFYALTPGRQRGYLMHFNSAKQSATRRARVEKCVSRIMSGKGLHD